MLGPLIAVMHGLSWGKDAEKFTGIVAPKECGWSSAAEKSELSNVDMDTHSSKYDMASSVKRFDIFFRSLLVCDQTTVMSL